MTQQLLQWGLAVTPFCFWPWALVPFEVPKVWLILIWIELTVGAFLWERSKKNTVSEKVPKNLRRWLPIIGFLGLAVISSLTGIQFRQSWLGNYYRMDGLIILIHVIALTAIITLVATKFFWKGLAVLFAASSSLLALSSIVCYLGRILVFHTWDWSFKFGGPLGQSNFLGGFLAITAPFTLVQVTQNKLIKLRLAWISGLAAQVAGLAITQSKGSFIIFGLAILSWFLLLRTKDVKNLLIGLLLGIGIGGVVLLGLQLHQTHQGFNADSRQRIFYKLALAIQQRPLQGWGWANVDKAFEENPWPFPILHDVYVDKAHSSLLEVLVTTGVFGLLAYLVIIGQTLRGLWLKKDKLYFIIFLLCVLQAQLNVISISQELLFWVCVAFSLQAKGE